MKPKLTLTAILILLTVFAFGQDVKQRLDSTVVQYTNGSNQLINQEKDVFTYNADSLVTELIYYEWDLGNSQWKKDVKDEYSYDEDNNLTELLFFKWDENFNQWLYYSKTEYSYDANGNIILYSWMYWDESISQFTYTTKWEYTYNSNGEMIQKIRYNWLEYTNPNQWRAHSKYDYTYDVNGSLIIDFLFEWIESTSEWVIFDKREYSYDSNLNRLKKTEYRWLEDWVFIDKNEFTYDINDNQLQVIFYDWDDQSSQWSASDKREYDYDGYNNRIQSRFYDWNYNDSDWKVNKKYDYSYDNTFSYSDLILPSILILENYDGGIGISVFFNHLAHGYVGYLYIDSEWVENYNATYYYSEQEVTSVSEINQMELNVYPNPFSDFVTFSIPDNFDSFTFELFDLQGRKIISEEIRSDEKVNMEGLNEGLYFYNLIIDGEKMSGKLMKQ